MRPQILSFVLIAAATLASPGWSASLMERYYTALQMETVFDVLRTEGLEAGDQMIADGEINASPAWTARLNRIYDTQKMDEAFREGIARIGRLDSSEAAIAFFESELGARIVQIEIDARRALSADEVEEQVLLRVEQMRDEMPERVALYEDFIKVNDLVNSNVSGALNANLAFYQGFGSHPEFAQSMTEDFMLTTVQEQEPDIRNDIENWTISFSALAYESLSDAEMREYIAISGSAAGQRLNAVLFAGFDELFEDQSYELGRATAEFSQGDEI